MTLDRTHRVLTVVVAVMMGAVLVVTVPLPSPAREWALGVVLLVVVTLVVSWARAPCGVEVSADRIRVLRRASSPSEIQRHDVVGIEDAPERPGWRAAGVGGFFGSYGLFRSSEIGFYWLYTTRVSVRHATLIRRRRGYPVLLRVDDAAGLQRALRDWL